MGDGGGSETKRTKDRRHHGHADTSGGPLPASYVPGDIPARRAQQRAHFRVTPWCSFVCLFSRKITPTKQSFSRRRWGHSDCAESGPAGKPGAPGTRSVSTVLKANAGGWGVQDRPTLQSTYGVGGPCGPRTMGGPRWEGMEALLLLDTTTSSWLKAMMN